MKKIQTILCLMMVAWADPQRIRLATWNVHNLFDAIDDRYDDLVPKPEQVEKKLEDLSLALGRIGADIIALQEVENLSILQRLARSSGYRYAILVEGNDAQRGIDVALLSKLKVRGYASHKNDRLPYVEGASLDTKFSRDCLEVHLATPVPMVLLVNHFKSKVGKGKSSDAKRRAQALRVAQMVKNVGRHYPGCAVVVLGDLNDCLESWPLEPLARSGLTDPFARLAPEQRYTHKHRGQGIALDQILIHPRLQARVLANSPEVGNDKVYRRCSDHRPMWLDFDL
ncbi:endonuclease/exonuclease/phosphatase family protein [bacterium]|nr:endonuclease/exonuclease/phosphatase family protein [bacterium]